MLQELIRKVTRHPADVPILVWKNIIDVVTRLYLARKGIDAGSNVKLIGVPLIERVTGRIRVGNNVTIRSSSRGYHASLYCKTKLMTDSSVDALIQIGDDTRINGACIHATNRISIGSNCRIAANVLILDNDGHGLLPDQRDAKGIPGDPVVIGDNVWIGINSIILKGVNIGRNSVIGAGSVVAKSIPANSVAIGNPAAVVRTLAESNHR